MSKCQDFFRFFVYFPFLFFFLYGHSVTFSAGNLGTSVWGPEADNFARPNRDNVVRELPVKGNDVLSAFTVDVGDAYQPIRVHVSKKDLYDYTKYCTSEAPGNRRNIYTGETHVCEDADDFTTLKRTIFLGNTLPSAIKLHTERLSVIPLTGPIIIPRKFDSGLCNEFTVLRKHRHGGVEGADYVLYVAAAPGASFGMACTDDPSTGRPLSGVLNFEPARIDFTRHSIRIVAHELAHAFGFDSKYFMRANMIAEEIKEPNRSYHVIISAKVLEMARKQYKCDAITHMALEDEGQPGDNSVRGRHWERLHAKDELMSMYLGASGGFYSELTLAAFLDLGFYQVNFSNAEPMRWGTAVSCNFINNKAQKELCMDAGISPYPDMFCNVSENARMTRCTFDRLALGSCPIKRQIFPPEVQYFEDPNVGISLPNTQLTNYCPVLEATTSSSCLDGNDADMPGSLIAPDSRCLTSVGLELNTRGDTRVRVGDVCARVRCGNSNQVEVQYKGDSAWHDCSASTVIHPSDTAAFRFNTGHIVCPTFEEVCVHVIQESDVDRKLLPVPTEDDESDMESGSVRSASSGNSDSSDSSEGSLADETQERRRRILCAGDSTTMVLIHAAHMQGVLCALLVFF